MEEFLSISQMAKLHGVSRQTLILYDKKGLLKPAYVSESGYRYYSAYQIPRLREICFLRKLDVSLEQIAHMASHSADEMYDFFVQMEEDINRRLRELEQRKIYIQQRMQMYADVNTKIKNVNCPYINYFPEIKALFVPFGTENMNRKKLHMTLMKSWNKVVDNDMVPSKGFGTLLKEESVREGAYLKGAGVLMPVPFPEQMKNQEELYTIPAGEYVTIYKYGMPYETQAVKKMMQWVEEHGYEIAGDVVDMCVLDTTFYNDRIKEDFCQLRIPVKEKRM